ncbi:MAG: tetratricopeptide repeat protein, partial [Anaerolineaceae bacterium]|nr:tetratricopeptide repeat protein [Anaerolineaceae bacterium]
MPLADYAVETEQIYVLLLVAHFNRQILAFFNRLELALSARLGCGPFNPARTELLEQSHEKHKKAEESRRFEIKIEDLIKAGKNDEAFSECLDSIEDCLVCGIANYYLGKIYLMRGQFEEAVETFYKSYLNDYKRIESLDEIASIYFQQTEYEKAIAMYNAIQDEKGYDDRIWCNIGICYIHLKQYNKAIEYFDKGISADKNDAFLFYNKGVS